MSQNKKFYQDKDFTQMIQELLSLEIGRVEDYIKHHQTQTHETPSKWIMAFRRVLLQSGYIEPKIGSSHGYQVDENSTTPEQINHAFLVVRRIFENQIKEVDEKYNSIKSTNAFPKDKPFHNLQTAFYIYEAFVKNIREIIDKTERVIQYSDELIYKKEVHVLCHRAQTELWKQVTVANQPNHTIINYAKSEANKLVVKFKSINKNGNLNHVKTMPKYRSYFDAVQPLFDLSSYIAHNFDSSNDLVEKNKSVVQKPTPQIGKLDYDSWLKGEITKEQLKAWSIDPKYQENAKSSDHMKIRKHQLQAFDNAVKLTKNGLISKFIEDCKKSKYPDQLYDLEVENLTSLLNQDKRIFGFILKGIKVYDDITGENYNKVIASSQRIRNGEKDITLFALNDSQRLTALFEFKNGYLSRNQTKMTKLI